MSIDKFLRLLEKVTPKIEISDTNLISSQIILAICLRLLATGHFFNSLMYLMQISKQFKSLLI